MATSLVPDDRRWNHNIHHHPDLLALAPARRALDVGCGEGMLSRRLATTCGEVVGIDFEQACIDTAVAAAPANATFVRGDVLTHPFEPASFDLVVCVAALHHMDAASGLRRLAELLEPGGRLGVVGLARATFPRDLGWQAAGAVATRYHRLVGRKRYWEHPAPIVWPPPVTFREMGALARDLLPGSTFRRRALWRYTLTWTKPG